MEVLKIIIVFLIIISLMRFKWPIGCAILIGSLFLGLFSGLSFVHISKIAILSTIDKVTLELATALLLIGIFSKLLEESGSLEEIVTSLRGLIQDSRIILAGLPALIGLMPMIGGAVFSAPLVEEVSKPLELSSEKKAFINYLFRHPFEYIWPLYPGIILAAKLTNIELQRLIILQVPLALGLLLMGTILGLTDIRIEKSHQKTSFLVLRRLILNLFPFLLVFALTLGLRIPLVISLCLGIVPIFFINRIDLKEGMRVILKGFSYEVVVLVIGIMVFKGILERSSAILNITSLLSQYRVPSLLMIIVCPFLVGLVSGVSVSYVGTCFPMLIPLFKGEGEVVLAFASGYAGVLLSPVHVCLVLTEEYFKADMKKIYSRLLLPVFVTLLIGFVIFLVL
ncbi:TPA: hypothetical protein DCX15_03210 [bacterium]|nr:hypothetical protein [bacterium]